MAIKFYFHKNPSASPNSTDADVQLYHPRVAGTKIRSELDLINSFTGNYSQTLQIAGALNTLLLQIPKFLLDGDTVKIAGLGTFQTRLGCDRPVTDPDSLMGASVRVKGVIFTPDKVFMRSLFSATLQKCREYAPVSLSQQERLDNIIQALYDDPLISYQKLQNLNGCCRSTLFRDISLLVSQGLLSRRKGVISLLY